MQVDSLIAGLARSDATDQTVQLHRLLQQSQKMGDRLENLVLENVASRVAEDDDGQTTSPKPPINFLSCTGTQLPQLDSAHANSAQPNSAQSYSAQPNSAQPNSAQPYNAQSYSATPNSALHFDDIDLNGDGVIDRAEFAKMQAHTHTPETATPELQKVARWQRELESELAEGWQLEPEQPHHGLKVGELQTKLANVEQQLRANGSLEHGAAGGTNLNEMSPSQMLQMLQAARLEVCANNPLNHAEIGDRLKLTIVQSLRSTCLLQCSRHASKLKYQSGNT